MFTRINSWSGQVFTHCINTDSGEVFTRLNTDSSEVFTHFSTPAVRAYSAIFVLVTEALTKSLKST